MGTTAPEDIGSLIADTVSEPSLPGILQKKPGFMLELGKCETKDGEVEYGLILRDGQVGFFTYDGNDCFRVPTFTVPKFIDAVGDGLPAAQYRADFQRALTENSQSRPVRNL